MELGKFIGNEISNAFERAGERNQERNRIEAETDNEIRNQKFASAMSAREETKAKLQEMVQQANERAKEIADHPIPTDAKEFIAYCKLCGIKMQMDLTDCMQIVEYGESSDVDNSDLDTKEPSRIIKQAWEQKFDDVLTYGECYLEDPTVISFCAEQRVLHKKYIKKKKRSEFWKKYKEWIIAILCFILSFGFVGLMAILQEHSII